MVITNPPYVRYQTLKSNSEVGLPDGKELRKNLIKHIQQSVVLSDSEKQLYLEVSGTAIGGGALKIEASHMRKTMFPKLGHESEKMLEGLGRRILKDGNITEDLQNQIDEVVLSPFGADSLLIKKQLDGLCAKKCKKGLVEKNMDKEELKLCLKQRR